MYGVGAIGVSVEVYVWGSVSEGNVCRWGVSVWAHVEHHITQCVVDNSS